jgi:hypothetical protein
VTGFFDRKGEPMEDVLAWARAYEDTLYRLVAVDHTETRMVSTIWEGFDTSVVLLDMPVPGFIFETALMENGSIVDKQRWATEEEALEGHATACRVWLGRDPQQGDIELIIEAEKRSGR